MTTTSHTTPIRPAASLSPAAAPPAVLNQAHGPARKGSIPGYTALYSDFTTATSGSRTTGFFSWLSDRARGQIAL